MRGIKRHRRVLVGALGIVAAAGIVGGAFYAHSAATPAKAASPFVAHPVTVTPTYMQDDLINDGQVKLSCQLPVNDPQRNGYTGQCYGPDQMRRAYDIQPLLDHGIDGTGRTIVLIEAYQSPTLESDLQAFDTMWGLPPAKVHIRTPYGVPSFDYSRMGGWSLEISLDVEWAHVVAPGAQIEVVEASSNQDADILAVTQWAVEHDLGDVISQSFGEAERCADPNLLKAEHKVFQEATERGMTLFASAGDQGAAQPTCDGSSYLLSASTPASDPLVTSVGGTHLNADLTTGAYASESVWNNNDAGGGGFSTIYKRPSWQAPFGVPDTGRGVPDVSYDADLQGGVPICWTAWAWQPDSTSDPTPFCRAHVGGTSAGSPQWAGIAALADQMAGQRLGFINAALYHIAKKPKLYADFHDITVGDNTFTGAGSNKITVTVQGYDAAQGWDAASGLGSLDVAKLAQDLIGTHVGNDGGND